MSKFQNHGKVLAMLAKSQEADQDQRDSSREAHLFIDKDDGQWEPTWWQASSGKPRYTFDITSPIVDIIAGEMEQADFNISVRPAGGDASKDDAKLLDGLIRNIENVSGATDIFNSAARGMVTCGIDGWQVKQKYVDDDSFDQDLVIERIANFIDSVWFGPFKQPDASDAEWCVVLQAMDKDEYSEAYPKGSGKSVGDGRNSEAYYQKGDQIVIANLYYITHKMRELLLMTSGKVVEADQVKDVLDDLAEQGDVVKAKRNRPKSIVKSRLFDGGGWLNKEQTTVFSQIPVIPTIGNFKIFENKLIYRGVVKKLIDPQRVFNYANSRKIEEGALAPRAKYWMTNKQMAGHEDKLATLNTNADPVQSFTPDPDNPGVPQQNGGAVINPGLSEISENMRGIIQQTASLFAASMGENPGLQSGVAIKRLQDKGDTGTIKYFRAQERAICRTARILVDAIPDVYSTQRQVRILGEDGSFDMKTLNEPIQDQETGRMVTVNDVSKGKYDVTCSSGPSFQNRQQETVAAITEIALVDPSAIQMGSDILFNNMSSPGMDLLAARKRQQLFQAGVIPEEQMTDEEKEKTLAAQQQPPQPDPLMVAAEAEAGKAKAQTDKVIVDAQVAQRREERLDFEAQSKQQNTEFEQIMAAQAQQMEQQQAVIDNQKALAGTLKLIRESLGAEAIINASAAEAFEKTAEHLNEQV